MKFSLKIREVYFACHQGRELGQLPGPGHLQPVWCRPWGCWRGVRQGGGQASGLTASPRQRRRGNGDWGGWWGGQRPTLLAVGKRGFYWPCLGRASAERLNAFHNVGGRMIGLCLLHNKVNWLNCLLTYLIIFWNLIQIRYEKFSILFKSSFYHYCYCIEIKVFMKRSTLKFLRIKKKWALFLYFLFCFCYLVFKWSAQPLNTPCLTGVPAVAVPGGSRGSRECRDSYSGPSRKARSCQARRRPTRYPPWWTAWTSISVCSWRLRRSAGLLLSWWSHAWHSLQTLSDFKIFASYFLYLVQG